MQIFYLVPSSQVHKLNRCNPEKNSYLKHLSKLVYCRNSSEDIDHLFIGCSVAKTIWRKIEVLTNWKMQHSNISTLCTKLCNIKQNSQREIIKFNVTAASLWSIWLERNNHTFKDKNSSIINLWENICALTGFWSTKHPAFSNYNACTISINLHAF